MSINLLLLICLFAVIVVGWIFFIQTAKKDNVRCSLDERNWQYLMILYDGLKDLSADEQLKTLKDWTQYLAVKKSASGNSPH